ncbi:hypothetical protein KSP40_PGU005187 [Platanthera guangdongensis]|uniref:DNA-(apurinic or apyrimidinic site) endonuclease 2 n=1 Tax=Platanthera guangdongensis TaxID=2320717 RepID=A0ABR2N3D7_9ASPA
MKIVTYNVNGLRQRVSQHGSLLKLLNSLDADIICFQETKLQKQDLSVDVTMAEGYEAFVSCTRTSCKGRLGYSGVATFCRVRSAFSTNEVALPVTAEEGFTGLFESSDRQEIVARDLIEKIMEVEGLEDTTKEDLLKVDSEGRCIITDHGHFVLFNLYGPRADSDDKDRTHFKFLFYKLLQRRWESLLTQGKRVVVVGDLNIAPAAIDRCDAEPEFDKNMFRTWLRSLLRECSGPFVDVFRSKHPSREGAYTCFSSRIGAEVFNYGSRIDHILTAGPCLHQNHGLEKHNLFDCHVDGSDIMIEFLRGSSVGKAKWHGGRSIKLEGSDHIPVYMILNDLPNLPVHSTPPLAVRYIPEVRGWQQTIGQKSLLYVMLKRGKAAEGAVLKAQKEEKTRIASALLLIQQGLSNAIFPRIMGTTDAKEAWDTLKEEFKGSKKGGSSTTIPQELAPPLLGKTTSRDLGKTASRDLGKTASRNLGEAAPRCAAYSQLTLRSYFQKQKSNSDCEVDKKNVEGSLDPYDYEKKSDDLSYGTEIIAVKSSLDDVEDHCGVNVLDEGFHLHDQTDTFSCSSIAENKNIALLEWKRIQQKMKSSIPLCKGHDEPCVSRSVRKEGPNNGRRFYSCARAQGRNVEERTARNTCD